MAISFNGYDAKYITMEKDSSTTFELGDLVNVNANGKAAGVTAGSVFIGVVVGINEDYITVQTGGYYEFNYSGTAPTSCVRLVANSKNDVKVDTSTNTNFVRRAIKLDTASKHVGVLL